MLTCLRLLEKMAEIPEIGDKWWLRMVALYGNDILMVELKKNNKLIITGGNIMKEIFESHVGSAWQTGRGRKADDNFFFD